MSRPASKRFLAALEKGRKAGRDAVAANAAPDKPYEAEAIEFVARWAKRYGIAAESHWDPAMISACEDLYHFAYSAGRLTGAREMRERALSEADYYGNNSAAAQSVCKAIRTLPLDPDGGT